MAKFAIFSTERGISIDPASLSPAPATLIVFDRDPIATGNYDPHAGSLMRGSVIPVLDGVVIQNFGYNIEDQRINISDEAALTLTTINAIKTLYTGTPTTARYFTDGYDCYKVVFSLPDGFVYRRNLLTSWAGIARYDYELIFVLQS